MAKVSKLELLPIQEGSNRLGFMVDGVPLLENFPSVDFVRPKDRTGTSDDELWSNIAKNLFASRLGRGSRDWQLSAVKQLLLRAPAELPDGRRRLYVCGGDCECVHVSCLIEKRDGLFIWRDFQHGSPGHSGAESFHNGAWHRIDFGSGLGPTGFDLRGGPFSFKESDYRNLFQQIEDRLTNSATGS
jgi:hypothetical protein